VKHLQIKTSELIQSTPHPPLPRKGGGEKRGDVSFLITFVLVGRSDPFSCCPGKKAGAEAKKGREKSSLFPPLCLRKETRWQKDRRAETAEARIGKRGTTGFFGEANAFLSGQGTSLLGERPLFAEPSENKNFSDINPFSFSTKLEMIHLS
jgi:hypothetical protein